MKIKDNRCRTTLPAFRALGALDAFLSHGYLYLKVTKTQAALLGTAGALSVGRVLKPIPEGVLYHIDLDAPVTPVELTLILD